MSSGERQGRERFPPQARGWPLMRRDMGAPEPEPSAPNRHPGFREPSRASNSPPPRAWTNDPVPVSHQPGPLLLQGLLADRAGDILYYA